MLSFPAEEIQEWRAEEWRAINTFLCTNLYAGNNETKRLHVI